MYTICEIDPSTNQSVMVFAAAEIPEEGLPENQYVVPEEETEGCGIFLLEDGEVRSLSDEEFTTLTTEMLTASLSFDARNERNQRLTACDWVVIMATETGENVDPYWAAYRQELRDLPDHPNFPHLEEADWPVSP